MPESAYAKEYIKKEIARFLTMSGIPAGHDVTLELLFDIVIPQLLHSYYIEDSQKTFTEFLAPNRVKAALTNPKLQNGLNSFFELMKSKEKYWQEISGKEFVYLGDLHDVITKIKVGDDVYYENFLDNETYFQTLVSEIVPLFSEILPKLKVAREYVKRQYIRHDESDFIPEKYFENFGLLLAFAFFFRLTDLHMENVVLSNNWTKIFDFEFAFSPDYDHLNFGIMPTNLISYKTEDNISALLGGYFKINSYMKPILLIDADGKPEIIWKTPSRRKLHNIPSKEKRRNIHPKEYVESIMEGFTRGHKELLERREKIVSFTESSNFRVRQLVRPTRQYRYLMVSYAYPQIHSKLELNDYYDIAFRYEPWKDFFNPIGDVLKPLEVNECASLIIPYFYSEIREPAVYHSSGKIVGQLKESPMDSFLRHVETNNYEKFVKRHIANTKRILTISYKDYLNEAI